MQPRTRVALRIATIRKRRRLTQAQLAERIERTVFAVSQLERGLSLPSFETLERLSAALEVPVRDFFDDAEEQAKLTPRRVRLVTILLDVLRGLSDDELEKAAELLAVLHPADPKRVGSGKSRR